MPTTTTLHAAIPDVPPGQTHFAEVATSSEWEQRLLAHAVTPLLTPASYVVEIGSGAGKWTLRLAPLVRELVAVDIDQAAIQRAQVRADAAGMNNVSFLLGSGRDLAPIGSGQVDLVFSYDTFPHLNLDDTMAYVAEIARVLREGGLALTQHAIADVGAMYARAGLRVESSWTEGDSTVVAARKPADSILPRFEQALRQAAAAENGSELASAVGTLNDVGQELQARLARLTAALGTAPAGQARLDVLVQIRRLLRG